VSSRFHVEGTLTRTATTVMLTGIGTAGFAIGQQLVITGVDGTRKIEAISGDTLTLSGGTLTPGTVQGIVAAVRVGGDTITVTGDTSTTAAGGPGSLPTDATQLPMPLVVYGDTSQDGVWYGGDPHTL